MSNAALQIVSERRSDRFPALLVRKLRDHLGFIYPDRDPNPLIEGVLDAFWPGDLTKQVRPSRRRVSAPPWSERDVILITYGNSLVDGQHPPLHLLDDFLTRYVGAAISGVHVLPFFPWTSDDGFAVVDYERVNSDLGSWEDMERIAGHHRLMADLVLNHVSSLHPWFVQFRQNQLPGRDYFRDCDPTLDLSRVVRPRKSPLLQQIETADGVKNVWCTFSHDQVDVDFANPDLLFEFLKIMRLFVANGVRTIRLDAVAFIWKEIGTGCVHLPQTHEIVRLMRTLCDYSREPIVLITETNVPNRENLSYFGDGNETHAIYNFPLPPLLLHALTTGDASVLSRWQRHMPPAPMGGFYFNFTASHDGIGVRAAEGFLSDDQLKEVTDKVSESGAQISYRAMPDGSQRPYEINVALWDAMKAGPGGEQHRFERFMTSQTISMALEGIPGIYIHSLLGTPNDVDRFERTGQNRSLNRHQWNYDVLQKALADPESDQSRVFNEMKRRLAIRTRQPAFHPNATQMTLKLDSRTFCVWRQSRNRMQSIWAIHSVSADEVPVDLSDFNTIEGEPLIDLLSGHRLASDQQEIVLKPYQSVWLSNVRY